MPLEDADAEGIWQLCPRVFETLAGGGALAPLIDEGLLRPSEGERVGSRTVSFDATRGSREHQHWVTFYVRQWTPNAGVTVEAVLQAFEQAHPVQRDWVADARRALNQATIRYARICVDGEPAWRLEEDEDTAAAATSGQSLAGINTSRIINFMSKFGEQGTWRTYAVPSLELPAPGPTRMPLLTLVDSYGWICPFIAPTTLPLAVTRQMRLKQSNTIVAPREAALIHIGAIGSPMLNSASHGGLGTLDGVAVPPRMQALRLKVAQACSVPRPPLGGFRQEVVKRITELFRSTAAALSLPVSSHIIASTTLYAAAPGRSFHVLKDVTAEDIAGEATRFGAFAGPGLSSFRNAMAWAKGERGEGEGLELVGPSADLWPFSAPRMKFLPQYCRLLRDILSIRQEAGQLQTIVIHSGDIFNCLITRRGLSSDSPDHSPGSMKTEDILQQADTLHVVEVCEHRAAATVVFDAGCIEYNGDYMVETDLQTLCKLEALKIVILEKHARPGVSAEEVIAAAQAESELLGLEEELVTVRNRVFRRYGSLCSLQLASRGRAQAAGSDADFWAGHTALQTEARRKLVGGRVQIKTAPAGPEREAQWEEMLADRGGTLDDLPLPKNVNTRDDPVDIAAYRTWFLARPDDVWLHQAAAGTRGEKGPARAEKRHQITPDKVAQVVGLDGLGRYFGAVSPQKARHDLAWRKRRTGAWLDHTWYKCTS